jgi:hypothetical protein
MAGFLAGLVSLGVPATPELRLRGEIPFEGIDGSLKCLAQYPSLLIRNGVEFLGSITLAA